MLSRREGLGMLAATLALGSRGFAATPARGTPFSWERLKAQAMRLASAPWHAPQPVAAAHAIDFDQAGHINYRADKALWRGAGNAEVRFFPLQRYADTPVEIAVVEGGMARPFPFTPDLFDVTANERGERPTLAPGFAGFRLMNANGRGDWLAFQGASYFRTAGALDQYGLSARGLAVNTGIDGREEFPIFTRFWLERGPGDAVTIYALLEGRSVTGAYRFVNRQTPDGPVQDVSLAIRLRADVERLGFAPLTSMFWYGEGNRAAATDWRPEIHDSDGLSLFTGAGERLWRPLFNPPVPETNSFTDKGPRGFGLLQRDRNFDHYQDDGAFYDKRPNLWVEPQGDWGKGAVMLYEIPTDREIDDNIVAFWTPAGPARAGAHYALDYRLRWTARDPAPASLARTVDCWTGTAGRPGHAPIAGARRLVADFEGGSLAGLTRQSGVEPVLSIVGGQALDVHAYPIVGFTDRWRLTLDVAQHGAEPTDLRAYLKLGKAALSETLLYRLS